MNPTRSPVRRARIKKIFWCARLAGERVGSITKKHLKKILLPHWHGETPMCFEAIEITPNLS
jgi:hypothetical protein